MKNWLYRHLPFIGVLSGLNFLVYFDYWLGRKYFSGSDFFFLTVPSINWQSDCLREFSYPFWHPYINFGIPYVEHYLNTALFPTHLLMGLLTGSSIHIIHMETIFWILMGGIGTYLCVVELGLSRTAALIAGTSYMFCSQMTDLTGWGIQYYNASCFPYLLLGYHKAKRDWSAFNLVAVAFLTMMLLGGYVSASLVGIIFFAGYVVIDAVQERKILFGVKFLLVTLSLGLLLSLPKLAPLYLSMHASHRLNIVDLSSDPLNKISLYNFMSALMPVKHYFSLYIGELSVLVLLFAFVKRKIKINALLLMFIVSAWFLISDSEGNISFLRSMANVLPFMRLVRNEYTYWFYPSLFAILYVSRYYDEFLTEKALSARLTATLLFASVITFVFFKEYNIPLYFNVYLIHLWLAAGWFVVTLFSSRRTIQTTAVILLLSIEFLLYFNRTNIDLPPVRNGDFTEMMLRDQFAASTSFRDDRQVGNVHHVRVLRDDLRPSIEDSKKWPYLNAGTDRDFVNNMNLKKFNGIWYNSQYRKEFREMEERKLVAQMDGWPLFGLLDRDALALTGSVRFDGISCSSFDFTVSAEKPSLFILHQSYDDRWKVFIDGKARAPFKAETYFMGLEVDPGVHHIAFRFRDRVFTYSLFVSIATLAGMSIIALWNRWRREKA